MRKRARQQAVWEQAPSSLWSSHDLDSGDTAPAARATSLAYWRQYPQSSGQVGRGLQVTCPASGNPKREVRNAAAGLLEASPISRAAATSGMDPGAV